MARKVGCGVARGFFTFTSTSQIQQLEYSNTCFKSCRYCAPHCLIAKFTSSLLKKRELTNLAFLEWITREWKIKVGPNKSLSRVQTTGTMMTDEMKMKKISWIMENYKVEWLGIFRILLAKLLLPLVVVYFAPPLLTLLFISCWKINESEAEHQVTEVVACGLVKQHRGNAWKRCNRRISIVDVLAAEEKIRRDGWHRHKRHAFVWRW